MEWEGPVWIILSVIVFVFILPITILVPIRSKNWLRHYADAHAALRSGRYGIAETSLHGLITGVNTLQHHREVQIDGLRALADLYLSTGRPDEAATAIDRAITARRQVSRTGAEEDARLCRRLAEAYRAAERLPPAVAAQVRAHDILATRHPLEAPELALARAELAKLQEQAGEVDAAIESYLAALPVLDKMAEVSDRDLGRMLTALARLYLDQARCADAKPLLVQALALYTVACGADHPEVAPILIDLAHVCYVLGKTGAAASLMTQAIAVFEKTYGSDHPSLVGPLNDYAYILDEMRRFRLAEAMRTRATAIAYGSRVAS